MVRTLPLLALLLIAVPARAADDLGLKVPPGFKVTLWADHDLANDIYAMTLDDRGRVLVTSRGWVKRLEDTDGDGKADKAKEIVETKTGGMGLYWDRCGLCFCGEGWFSFYFQIDADLLTRAAKQVVPLAFGEHGGHAIRQGPDGCYYVIYGNSAQVEKVKLDPSSPIQKPAAGGILRISNNLKKVECIAQGFRNPYDFDFTPLGDIITYDSDTERDYLLPWYSPTRLYQVAHGQHHGWRLPGYLQSLARRDYYADTVDILWPIGRGSPTGVVCYRHYQFPKHYRGGVFALDWTFGKIYFLPLEADGSSYKTKAEVFLEPAGGNGFAPTDACVAPDGSLFVCIGGRGTRGAIYKIEYVGTKEEPAGKWEEPKDDLNLILDAPQPLESWSRKNWERKAYAVGWERIAEAVGDSKQSIQRRIRGTEVLVDRFGEGLPIAVAKRCAKDPAWQVRARTAWALGRRTSSVAVPVLLALCRDDHPKVRVAALDALTEALAAKVLTNDDLPPELIADNLGHADKRVRMAACRFVPPLNSPAKSKLGHVIEGANLRTRLTMAFAERWTKVEPALFPTYEKRLPLEALKSPDPQLRLDALRLLMLLDGDWCLEKPPAVVFIAYALQNRPNQRRDIEREIARQVRALFPTGDKHFDTEAARYLAMIEDADPETAAKVLARITPDSDATDDVHHLIVLSRLRAPRPPEQSAAVVSALLGLDAKLRGQQLRIKQTWGPRLAEVVANLAKEYPDFVKTLLDHPAFARPAHVAFTGPFAGEERARAARLFLDAVKKDADFPWSPELVELLAALPAEESRPAFRKQWSDLGLRDAILPRLLREPDHADRARFLDGLESPQRDLVLGSIDALMQLPRDSAPANLVPVLRRLRLSLQEPKEREVREKLLALLNRQAGTRFAAGGEAFAWFEREHPDNAKLLRGDEDDAEQWKKALAAVPWEKGDVERGAKLFRERSCLACHSGTSRIGPDLTGVAGRFARDDLFTAIIAPSRDVAPAYRVNDIETLAGKTVSGIVVFESADGVIVQTGAAMTVRIDAADIATRKPSARSLMPAGLLRDLKPPDLADLYAYLKSLKNGP
jgi:putative heme-binding domain-containing protein